MAFVYMLRCADGTLYTGYTLDLQRRVACHNAGRGAKYTRSRLPVELVWSAELPSPRDARRAEVFLKQLSRPQKDRLLAGELTLRQVCGGSE